MNEKSIKKSEEVTASIEYTFILGAVGKFAYRMKLNIQISR